MRQATPSEASGVPGAAGRRIVRAPNHVGDVLMSLPGLFDSGADVMVREHLVPLFDMAGFPRPVHPLRRGADGFLDAALRLRRGRYDQGFLLTPAFGAALLFRVGGVRRLRGTATDGRTFLLADAVPRDRLGRRHRILQYRFLLGQDGEQDPVGVPIRPPAHAEERWARRLDIEARGRPVAFFPGSNAPARRWPPERFVELGTRLSAAGQRVLVLGGPGERGLTAAVAASVPGAVDLGGKTDLPGLAAVLRLSAVLVTNDTGPMHVSGAVGTPSVTVWGSSDPVEVRPIGAPHHAVALEAPLPCMPCRKNRCPRSGSGYRSPSAEVECLRLVGVEPVEAAVRQALAAEATRPGPPAAPEHLPPSTRQPGRELARERERRSVGERAW